MTERLGAGSAVWGDDEVDPLGAGSSPAQGERGSGRTRTASPVLDKKLWKQKAQPVASIAPPELQSLLGITAFNFPYGCICTTMGMFILPAEALRLWPQQEGVALGYFLLLVGLSQLVCPYTGLASDRCGSKWGRRRPYIFWGAACGMLCIASMWAASAQLWPWTYSCALFAAMIALNVVYSAQCGLVPDFVPEHRQGAASGVTAVMQLAGSITGFSIVIATRSYDHKLCYPFYMVLLTVTTAIICYSARETPLVEHRPPPTWKEAARSYVIDTSRDLDFFWVFVGRALFYVAVSCQAFMLYYLRDAVGTTEDSERRRQMATIALIGQAAAALVAYPVGGLSDRTGRKPLVYVACGVMSLVYIAFILAPVLADGSAQAVSMIYATAAFYGVGNGCYLAVDYALALDCLPSKATSAQDLGVWGIAGFLGSALGPMLWGAVLSAAGRSGGGQAAGYTYRGYVAMLSGGCVASLGAGFFVRFIRNAR